MKNLITIKDKHYLSCKIVMLATKEITNVYKFEDTNKLIISNHSNQKDEAIPQHLYFLSNEEIKKNNWVYNPIYKTVYQWIKNADIKFDRIDAKKIVATTDSSLSQTSSREIPKPSKEFIQAFIKAYNEGKPITKVLIEMEDNGEEDWVGDDFNGESFWNSKFELKVNSSNEITIKKVKDSYTREEVIELLSKHFVQAGSKIGLGQDVTKFTKTWIEENL